MNDKKIRFLTITAILGALATVFQMFEIPVPVFVPGFIKLDFSDLPAILATFLVSPVSGVIVCLIKNVIHIATSSSVGIGELANFLTSAACVLPAGIIYLLNPTKKMAVVSMLAGAIISAVASIFVNYYITYPFYMSAFGLTEGAIMGMYSEVVALQSEIFGISAPPAVTLWDAFIWFNAPFTFVKFAVCSVVVFFIYKPLAKITK
ncbi:MAG: ECF transporter S component, partial [Oscillospiraceae bacterium]|nr:ECF transporter S component [Oscillospiraceae bacterium]